ncbi:MAG: peptidoglycan bridge formation glycyltransferase FemA/FemB family protein [Flavobacteriaceae bacterium]|nr:peptidoglycan bridge formation glycyltransferase FemA/FemB family protein [Flavobacteriaceae bacterium]
MKILVTKEQHWIDKWDQAIEQNRKGHYFQCSTWAQSYRVYNFDQELVLLIDNETILAGYWAVIPRFSIVKFYIVPFGPINFLADELELLENEIIQRAKKHRCCYVQVTPFNTQENQFEWLSNVKHLNLRFSRGKKFKNIAIPTRISILDLKALSTEEDLLSSFKSSTRRHIRSSLKKELKLVIAITEAELQEGYRMFEINAKEGGYAVRSWKDFRKTILDSINNKQGKMLLAYHQNQLKGAIYLYKSGDFYTYISGGTIKEKPDLKAGYFLHWQAIKISLAEGLKGYNIGHSGSPGVLRFKEGFNGLKIDYPYTSHKILRPLLFRMYSLFYPLLRKHKKTIARILSKNK